MTSVHMPQPNVLSSSGLHSSPNLYTAFVFGFKQSPFGHVGSFILVSEFIPAAVPRSFSEKPLKAILVSRRPAADLRPEPCNFSKACCYSLFNFRIYLVKLTLCNTCDQTRLPRLPDSAMRAL